MSAASLPDGYTISVDPARLDLDIIHAFLSGSYWAKNIPREIVARSVAHSLCWGVYLADAQIGFARVVSDRATFAYLCDVFILPEHRGRGLSKALVTAIQAHPDLQGLRRWLLVTADAHDLYESYGFSLLKNPDRHMECHRPGIYQSSPPS